MSRIGFAGLGIMGSPMAANLVKAGHQADAIEGRLPIMAGGEPVQGGRSIAACLRVCPATSCPALTRFSAIGAPMMPRPMNPIRDTCRYLQPKLAVLSAGSDGLYSQPIQPG